VEAPFPAFPDVLYTDSLKQDSNPWIDRLRSGDPRALARAISTVENRAEGWSELLKALFPYTGKARVIGLTGPPGAGKSTLVDQLAKHYRKEKQTVGIIAVDPTSPYTGGAILGDRIRMQDHYSDPGFSFAAWPHADRSAGWRARPPTRRPYLTLRARSGHDRNGGVGRTKSILCGWPMSPL